MTAYNVTPGETIGKRLYKAYKPRVKRNGVGGSASDIVYIVFFFSLPFFPASRSPSPFFIVVIVRCTRSKLDIDKKTP